jgi:predicted 2-oxoglutarate/Fe(II)-dependent dioxygenase YbiX
MFARPFLEKSKIHTSVSQSLFLSKKRTSSSCVIRHNAITDKIKSIAETLTGFPIGHMETTQVVQYKQGEMFDFHYDGVPSKKLSPAWSRVATVMIYLNDNFEGGETEFKKIHAKIRPEQGKVVLFWSALNGNLIPESLHRGNKITKGTKWLVNQWVHSIPL